MFTLEIQVEDSDDLTRIGVLSEIVLSDKTEFSEDGLNIALDWVLHRIRDVVSDNFFSECLGSDQGRSIWLRHAKNFDTLSELIRKKIEEKEKS